MLHKAALDTDPRFCGSAYTKIKGEKGRNQRTVSPPPAQAEAAGCSAHRDGAAAHRASFRKGPQAGNSCCASDCAEQPNKSQRTQYSVNQTKRKQHPQCNILALHKTPTKHLYMNRLCKTVIAPSRCVSLAVSQSSFSL